MQKLIFFSTILISFNIAKADIIRCNFTEPFVNSTYSMTQSTLTYKTMEGQTKVIKNVSFQIKGPEKFELFSRGGMVLQTLTLNFKGSDGMSDNTYPYEVKDNNIITNKAYGGCTSNFLKATPAHNN